MISDKPKAPRKKKVDKSTTEDKETTARGKSGAKKAETNTDAPKAKASPKKSTAKAQPDGDELVL